MGVDRQQWDGGDVGGGRQQWDGGSVGGGAPLWGGGGMGGGEPLWRWGGMGEGEAYLDGAVVCRRVECRGGQSQRVEGPTRVDRFPRQYTAKRRPAANSRSISPPSSSWT